MPSPRPEKVFGRYNELVLLCLGFVLTTGIGGFLTRSYQERARLNAERAAHLQAELVRATAVSEEITRVLDRRLYRARALVWAIKDRISEADLQLAQKEYRDAKDDWNENLNRRYSAVEYSFGQAMRQELEIQIAAGFRQLHESITECVGSQVGCDIAQLERDLDVFNPRIYAFDLKMLQRLKLSRVDG